jgi:hypothetical protein
MPLSLVQQPFFGRELCNSLLLFVVITAFICSPSAERDDEFMVVAYRAHDIHTHPCVRLELADLLLIVLLVGGDYSVSLIFLLCF